MPESRLKEVAQELLSQSKEKKVAWEETGRRDSYRVFFPDIGLTISRTYPKFEDSDLKLELISENGTVIEALETEPEDDVHSVLSQIFDLAEQLVRDSNIDKALDYLKRS